MSVCTNVPREGSEFKKKTKKCTFGDFAGVGTNKFNLITVKTLKSKVCRQLKMIMS